MGNAFFIPALVGTVFAMGMKKLANARDGPVEGHQAGPWPNQFPNEPTMTPTNVWNPRWNNDQTTGKHLWFPMEPWRMGRNDNAAMNVIPAPRHAFKLGDGAVLPGGFGRRYGENMALMWDQDARLLEPAWSVEQQSSGKRIAGILPDLLGRMAAT